MASEGTSRRKTFAELLNQTARAASKHNYLMTECEKYFTERYGIHYSEANADGIIDVLDQGIGGGIDVAACDEEMRLAGYPPLHEKGGGDNGE